MTRVVITGMSAITPIGQSWDAIAAALRSYQSAVVHMDQWQCYNDLRTRLGCPVTTFSAPSHYSRRQTRSMGRVALMAAAATESALEQAGLLDHPVLHSGEMGIAYGSSSGSPKAIGDFGNMLLNNSMNGLNANTYIRMMSHTAPVNIGVMFGIKGRVITTSSACTSGSQGIGYAYEAIKSGYQKLMIAGGSEELDAIQAAVFDTLFATSTCNEGPTTTPRPFDRDRDGLVIGEGAATLILEDLDHALDRGAAIVAEVVGFATNSDGSHITQPESSTMQVVMEKALAQAKIDASAIGYINAHGTATDRGDIAESRATVNVFGSHTPISSIKSFIGHTLGACGAIEAYTSIQMMIDNWFAPTINLENVDNQCASLDYIMHEGREIQCDYVMSNNFAFGGINTSLVFKRWED